MDSNVLYSILLCCNVFEGEIHSDNLVLTPHPAPSPYPHPTLTLPLTLTQPFFNNHQRLAAYSTPLHCA